MLITKEVVREGEYWYTDPKTGKARLLKVTPELIKYWHDSGNEMLSAKLSIPVPLEHQFDARPMTAAERAAKTLLHNGGWVDKFEIKDGILFSKIDVTNPDAAKQISNKSIRWTSPWFNSFDDPTTGKKREGVISHLALTSTPRMVSQEGFPSIAASLANLDGSFSLAVPEKGICLSRAGLLKQGSKGLRPQYPMAFSLWTGAKFSAEEQEEFKKEEKEPEGESKPKGEEKPDGMKPEETDPLLGDAEEDIELHEMVVDLLEAMGWTFDEAEITADNFVSCIYRAVMNKVREQISPEPLNEPLNPNPNPAPKPPTVEQQPMYMSIEQVNAIEDPVMKGIAMSLLTTQQELANEKKKTEGLQQNVLAVAKVKRAARIEKLARTLTVAARDQLLKLAEGAAFSMSEDLTTAVDSMDAWLSMLESQQKSMPDLLNTKASLSVAPQPTEFTGQVSAERMAQLKADYVDKHVPDPNKKAG